MCGNLHSPKKKQLVAMCVSAAGPAVEPTQGMLRCLHSQHHPGREDQAGRCWAEVARPLVSPSVRSHFALLELS